MILPFGAGITQLAECQLPKLKVAGSIPVARSILLMALLALLLCIPRTCPAADPRLERAWRLRAGLEAGSGASERELLRSAQNLFDRGLGPLPEVYRADLVRLRTRIRSGDHLAYIAAVIDLLDGGRVREAELYMLLAGRDVPATRMDLAKGLSWYGRYRLGEPASRMLDPPEDVESHSYAYRIAALIDLGWMVPAPDGLFHPHELAGEGDLVRVWERFLDGEGDPWPADWISVGQLDVFLRGGRPEGER